MATAPTATFTGRSWRTFRPVQDFLATEVAGGVLIVGATVLALVLANAGLYAELADFWETETALEVGDHALRLTVRELVNDGLMTLFFLVVGLEIKRELTTGHLNTVRAAALPAVAAMGGIAVPALIYVALGHSQADGWAIPVATDIALALGVVAVLAPQLPQAVRIFLLAVAVVDDIAAVVIIAIFYRRSGSIAWLLVAVGAVALAYAFRAVGVLSFGPFVVAGGALWFGLHEAGVHATLAGVVMGLLAPSVPYRSADLIDDDQLTDLSGVSEAYVTVTLARQATSVVEWLEFRLHSWVSFVIVPLFAFANTGIRLRADTLSDAVSTGPGLGIVLGLLVGKPVGILTGVLVGERVFRLSRPVGATTGALLVVAAAAGVGFTVSLFVTELAFAGPTANTARAAVLIGSVASAVLAGALARLVARETA